MSKSLLDLLNKTRGDIASKRGNNVDLTRLKDGNNYLRIFPNKDDPNGVFFQTFGMHYVKHQNEEGKDVTTAYICEAAAAASASASAAAASEPADEGLDDLLAEAAEFDAVEHASEDAGGVCDVLFVAKLDVVLAEVFGMSALVYGGDGKGAACTGRGLLEDERDVFALEEVALYPGAFFVLEVC